MKKLKVKDVMTRGVVAIHEKASVQEAVEIMADYDISGLVVTSSRDIVTGVLSEMDVIRVLDESLERVKVEEIMTSPAIAINRDESLQRACQLMKDKNIHRLVVHNEDINVSGNGSHGMYLPCGILSISDVIRTLADFKQNIISEGCCVDG
jgi:CBS domain-containing protein